VRILCRNITLELIRCVGAISKLLLTYTESLDAFDIGELGSIALLSTKRRTKALEKLLTRGRFMSDVESIINACNFITNVPGEYLPRSVRETLATRILRLDMISALTKSTTREPLVSFTSSLDVGLLAKHTLLELASPEAIASILCSDRAMCLTETICRYHAQHT
jgi:hypothetical protein